MDDNRHKYDKLIKRIKGGNIYVDDLIDRQPKRLEQNALLARDLAENTLGREYLKQTGVSIPNIKTAKKSEVESFLNKIKEEQYPELFDSPVELEKIPGAKGQYYPDSKIIKVAEGRNLTPEELVGTMFHESGHAYDYLDPNNKESIDVDANQKAKLKELKSKKALIGQTIDDLDAYDLSEILQKGHHKKIPDLREGSYGFGALKSLIKKGGFKVLGPLAGTAAAVSSGDVSAAIPILDAAEETGPSKGSIDQMIESPDLSYEERERLIKKARGEQ